MKKYTGFIKENKAPFAASKIGVYRRSDGQRIGTIPLEGFKPNYGTRLYRFGIISDTHYNDTDGTGNLDDNYNSHYRDDLKNALEFFQNKESVDFICASGDITTNDSRHAINFHNAFERYAPSTPFFTCKGNHDNAAYPHCDSGWKDIAYPISTKNPFNSTMYFCDTDNPENITNQEDKSNNNGNCFYFIKNLANSKKDIFIFLSLDYNNTGSNSSGSQGSIDNQYYHPNALIWLEKVLEKYKNERCFIFTHLFFWKKGGNWNQVYYPGTHQSKYVLYGNQYDFLNELNNKYKKAVWFSGHSHYIWEGQATDEGYLPEGKNNLPRRGETYIGNPKTLNICNFDKEKNIECGYNVHIPSLARPIACVFENYHVLGERAQGGIVDVYQDYILVRGVDFIRTENQGEEKEEKTVQIKAEHCYVHNTGSNSTHSVYQEGDYVVFTFPKNDQRFLINPVENGGSFDNGRVTIQDIKIFDARNNDITTPMLSTLDPLIGFYTTNNVYSLTDCTPNKYTSSTPSGLEFKRSSRYYQSSGAVTIKMKCTMTYTELSEVETYYEAKYLPIAQYKLDV